MQSQNQIILPSDQTMSQYPLNLVYTTNFNLSTHLFQDKFNLINLYNSSKTSWLESEVFLKLVAFGLIR